jgi:hypothetical protein
MHGEKRKGVTFSYAFLAKKIDQTLFAKSQDCPGDTLISTFYYTAHSNMYVKQKRKNNQPMYLKKMFYKMYYVQVPIKENICFKAYIIPIITIYSKPLKVCNKLFTVFERC